MDNRLLSEQDCQMIFNEHEKGLFLWKDISGLADKVAAAQDAKTLAILIQWLNEPCTRHKHYNTYSSTYTRNECSKCWAKLKEVK